MGMHIPGFSPTQLLKLHMPVHEAVESCYTIYGPDGSELSHVARGLEVSSESGKSVTINIHQGPVITSVHQPPEVTPVAKKKKRDPSAKKAEIISAINADWTSQMARRVDVVYAHQGPVVISSIGGDGTPSNQSPTERVTDEILNGRPLAGIYIRVSTERQRREGTSLATQLDRCLKQAMADGYQVLSIHIWEEQMSGAYMDNRPKLEQMLQIVKSGLLAAVYAFDQDRLSREPRDTINLMYIFEQARCRLIFLTGPQDESWLGQMIRMMLSFAAKQERMQFLERSDRGRREKAKNGIFPGGAGIYGYDRVGPSIYAINESEAQIVRWIFHNRLQGKTYHRLATELNEMGALTKKGHHWTGSRVSKTLKNEAYIGVLYFGSYKHWKDENDTSKRSKAAPEDIIRIEGVTPRIIPQGIWDDVKGMRGMNQSRRRPDGSIHLLTGFVECGTCEKGVVGNSTQKGNSYYRCHATTDLPGRPKSCEERSMLVDRLDRTVVNMLRKAFNHPEMLLAEYHPDRESGDTNIKAEKKKLKREIKDHEGEMKRLISMGKMGRRSAEMVAGEIAALEMLLDEKERMHRQFEEQEQREENWDHLEEQFTEFCQTVAEGFDQLDREGLRELMGAFRVRVRATPAEVTVIMSVDPNVTINGSRDTIRLYWTGAIIFLGYHNLPDEKRTFLVVPVGPTILNVPCTRTGVEGKTVFEFKPFLSRYPHYHFHGRLVHCFRNPEI